jgi:hypothetical protein
MKPIEAKTLFALFLPFILIFANDSTAAAAFRPGDKIEYKVSGSPEKWEPGEVVRVLPGETQVVIRQRPNQFYKDGFQRAYSISDVRRPGAEPAKEAVGPKTAPANTPVATAAPATRNAAASGGGLMSQQEILDFLRTRLGDQPFQHPQRDQIKRELADTVKRRGVDFHYEAVSDFSNQLGKYGATTDITTPISVNFGPPTQRGWLIGSWSMDIIGSPTYFVRGNVLYRRGEIGAKGGLLTINPDGTYVWQAYMNDPPAKHVRGKWRNASAQEMNHQGGDGIVLLAAKSGWDWIVTQERASQAGDSIRASELTSRQMREFGGRKAAGR